MLAYIFTTTRVDETIRAVVSAMLCGTLLAGPRSRVSAWLWPLIAAGFLIALVQRPLDVPNHHWMMTYLSSAIALCVWFSPTAGRCVDDLQSNARWFLVVLMGFATVQKLLSPHFMDGTYIGFEIVRGGFASPLLMWIPQAQEIVGANADLVTQLHSAHPSELKSVTLEPYVQTRWISFGFVYSILAIEFWLFASMLTMPKRLITHFSLMAFALSLSVLRQEFTFISVVCALGLLSCGGQFRWLRWCYAGAGVVIASAVLKTLN